MQQLISIGVSLVLVFTSSDPSIVHTSAPEGAQRTSAHVRHAASSVDDPPELDTEPDSSRATEAAELSGPDDAPGEPEASGSATASAQSDEPGRPTGERVTADEDFAEPSDARRDLRDSSSRPAPAKAPAPTPTPAPTTAPSQPAAPPPPAATPAPPPAAPPPPPPPATGVYGSIAADSKANLQIGGSDGWRVSHRFRAGTSAPLTAIRFAQRGGAGYSAGNGGVVRISIRPDAGGAPSDAVLASVDRAFGNPGGEWSTYLDTAFPAPATLTAGQLYHVVFENVGAVGVDYISINELFVFNATVPRQPLYGDANYAVLTGTAGGWSVLPNYTATMDLTYANGHHDGMGYTESMWQQYGVITGTSHMVRERFTVSGGSRSVTSATLRVRRSSGTSPLIVTLEAGNGAAMASVAIPAAAIPVIGADSPRNGAGSWVTAAFPSPQLLASGGTYNLRLSTAPDTVYTVVPVREGTDVGFRSYRFTDGDGQRTTNGGGAWSNLYLWSPVDLQFYLA